VFVLPLVKVVKKLISSSIIPSSVSPKDSSLFVTSTLSSALIAVKFSRKDLCPSVNLIFLTSGPLLIAARILAVQQQL
jgi:hypothetical protein